MYELQFKDIKPLLFFLDGKNAGDRFVMIQCSYSGFCLFVFSTFCWLVFLLEIDGPYWIETEYAKEVFSVVDHSPQSPAALLQICFAALTHNLSDVFLTSPLEFERCFHSSKSTE